MSSSRNNNYSKSGRVGKDAKNTTNFRQSKYRHTCSAKEFCPRTLEVQTFLQSVNNGNQLLIFNFGQCWPFYRWFNFKIVYSHTVALQSSFHCTKILFTTFYSCKHHISYKSTEYVFIFIQKRHFIFFLQGRANILKCRFSA